YNVPGSPQSVPLSGTGAAPPTPITLSPSKLTFPSQTVNITSASQSFDLTNTGGQPVTISGIGISGDFAQTNNCSSLAAGATCSVFVRFSPTKVGDATGAVSVAYNGAGSPQSVPLRGT